MDIDFYKRMIVVYTERNVSPEIWNEFYGIMFNDIKKVKPEELMPEYLELYKLAENYFASIEDYERAKALDLLADGARMVFQARERIEKLKQDLINRFPN